MLYNNILEMKKNSNNFIFKLTLYILCVVIPSITLYYVSFSIIEAFCEKKNHENIKYFRGELAKISREGSNEIFIQNQLNYAYGLLSEENITSKNIDKAYVNMKKTGLNFIHFRFFDSNSGIIPFKDDSSTMKTIIQKIFDDLVEYDKSNSNYSIKNKTFFNMFFGSINPFEVAARKSELIECNIKGKDGYFYWNTFYSHTNSNVFNGGMVAWFVKEEIPEYFSIKQLIDDKNKEGQEFWGLCGLKETESFYPATFTKKITIELIELKKIINSMIYKNQSYLKKQNMNFYIESYETNKVIFCLTKTNPMEKAKDYSFIIKITILCLCFSFIKVFLNKFNSVTLPLHLIFLLSINIVIMLGIGFIGFKSFGEVKINYDKESLSNYIYNIDRHYDLAKYKLEQEYRDLSNDSFIKQLNTTEMNKMFDKLKAENKIDRVYMVNRSGKIFYNYPYSSGNDIISQFIKPAASKIYNEHYASNNSWSEKIKDTLIQNAVKSYTDVLEEGAEFLKPFEKFNQISEFWFTNRRYYIYTNFVYTKNYKEPLLMLIWHKTSNFSSDYLKQQIKNSENINSSKNFIISVMIDKKGDEMPYPLEYSKYKFIREIRDKLLYDEKNQTVYANIANEKYIVVGSGLKSIPNKYIAVLKPVSRILKNVSDLFYITLFSCICSLIGIALSRFYDFK